MLTDESINLAQNHLYEAFPSISGLQDTAIGATQTFNVGSGNFIQILHDGNLHWVCTSNISFDSPTDVSDINVYDSYNHGYITKMTKWQMATFMFVELPEMDTYIKSVQQQPNGVDCGVFAIAFATALAFGDDPTRKRFNVKKMRHHLRDCLKVKRMSPFPEIAGDEVGSVKVDACKEKKCVFELFCICRMPYEKPKKEDDFMAECDACKEWYHKSCLKIPDRVFKKSNSKYLCTTCTRAREAKL